MPNATNPEIPEFYVYEFAVARKPFYIGVGRSERASDRLRYVSYMLRREKEGKSVHWTLSTKVIASLLKRNVEIRLRYVNKHLTRRKALEVEKAAIGRRLQQGHILANIQHNPARPSSHLKVVRRLLLDGT